MTTGMMIISSTFIVKDGWKWFSCCFGSSEGTPGGASPEPRRASAASWFAPCSAPSLPRREWGNPAGDNDKSDWFPSRICCETENRDRAFTVSSNLEYLSVSERNISLGGTFIFASLAIWNGKRHERTCWFSQKKKQQQQKKTEPCETSCSCFLLAASSFFSFFSSSIWQKKEATVDRWSLLQRGTSWEFWSQTWSERVYWPELVVLSLDNQIWLEKN